MKKRELGKSGLFVSELGLGCMSLPDDLNESKKVIDAALDAGINFLDTADLYDSGKNEQFVGHAIKGKREDIILATKVGNKMNENGTSWAWDPSKNHIESAIKKSLHRLGTDYIDLYQLHGGTMEDDVEETIDAFESLKKEGLIRQYGISSIRPNVIERFLEKGTPISIMMQYSMLDRRPEEWFPMIHHAAASVLTRGTLAKGLLTSEALARTKANNGFVEYATEELSQTVTALDRETEDLHAAAIAFVLREQTVASALVGARSVDQLLDSVIAYDKGCTEDVLDKLTTIVQTHTYKEHRV
ncbi:aldo/keto reductase [Sporosarcina sp. G11-34]|uniref:aldo/keto reductase n=1 Tax=Sporosarcina sp. G11-34 TaxID=2849605 RepID=UPI0022A98A0F|nr:aldo/keto reductase [Sporosarcina sp. G11-34]MCZ2259514.1 aldo/keto reductase [Sporosarcina sp. G11-34]